MQITITRDSIKELLQKKITHFFNNVEIFADITDNRFFRIEIKIHNINLLQWLSRQSHAVKTYWKDRQQEFEMAGVGEADVVEGTVEASKYENIFSRLRRYLTQKYPRLRYYGGIQFRNTRKKDAVWLNFKAFRFVVPLFEIYADSSGTYFACNILINPKEDLQTQLAGVIRQLNALNWNETEEPFETPDLIKRVDTPTKSEWHQNIARAMAQFQSGKLGKIVLARRSEFEFTEPVDGVKTLKKLQEIDPTAFYFCFQPLKNIAFIGATPERLYRRVGDEIFSEAVAGTRPRGNDRNSDEWQEIDLLNNEKEYREHQFVVKSLGESFEALCKRVEYPDKTFILKLSRLQHLYAKIKGWLKEDVSDADILRHLHPTPAVGGYPKDEAMRFIEEIEPFDRGWYAGPIGWVSYQAAEFAVAIRSAMAAENKLILYAGAGIVPGSDPEKEWTEVENKISNYLKVYQIN
jgi:menaquinone-specific isochorismate synthase